MINANWIIEINKEIAIEIFFLFSSKVVRVLKIEITERDPIIENNNKNILNDEIFKIFGNWIKHIGNNW